MNDVSGVRSSHIDVRLKSDYLRQAPGYGDNCQEVGKLVCHGNGYDTKRRWVSWSIFY